MWYLFDALEADFLRQYGMADPFTLNGEPIKWSKFKALLGNLSPDSSVFLMRVRKLADDGISDADGTIGPRRPYTQRARAEIDRLVDAGMSRHDATKLVHSSHPEWAQALKAEAQAWRNYTRKRYDKLGGRDPSDVHSHTYLNDFREVEAVANSDSAGNTPGAVNPRGWRPSAYRSENPYRKTAGAKPFNRRRR